MPLLISIFSNGQLFFAAPTTTNIKVKPAYRIGRKYLRLTEFEHAKIAAVAPLVHILIAIILSFTSISILQDFALINTMMAVSFMLPLSNLLGSTIFFNSKPLYMFLTVFILVAAILLNLLTGFYTAIIAIVLAVATLFIYLWQFYKK